MADKGALKQRRRALPAGCSDPAADCPFPGGRLFPFKKQSLPFEWQREVWRAGAAIFVALEVLLLIHN